MNNAGVAGLAGERGTSWKGLDSWKKVFDVNLFGYVLSPAYTSCDNV